MIAASILELTRHEVRGQPSFPTIATSTRDEDPNVGSEQPLWRKCKGCLWRLSKFSPKHSRVRGECMHPDIIPFDEGCPGCRNDKPRSHPSHTYDSDCRHAVTEPREGTTKRASVRESKAPRSGRVPVSEDPTSGMGMPSEEEYEPSIRPPEEDDEISLGLGSDIEPTTKPRKDRQSQSSSSGAIAARHQDAQEEDARQPRAQPIRHSDMDTQTPDMTDWTKFDLQSSLRALHHGTPAQKRRMVRKLHLRWWHCGSTTLHRLLKAAGAPQDVLDMVHEIVDTCRICRTWVKPVNTMASSRLITSFNQEVECDIVYVRHQGHQKMFMHFVDRAVRWCATIGIEDRATSTLLNAIDVAWVSIYGPMKVLISDGEQGLDNDESTWYFQVRGIQKRTAAVGQHVRIADRRVQILRNTLHKISDQLASDGIAMPFARVLSESTFVINTITSIGGVSPYVAVFGRSPALLPELGPRDVLNDDRNDECPIQHSTRIRELAIQTITEQTARERLRIASRTPTRPAGEEMSFGIGDSVEYYREPSHKDISGWRGPAVITDLTRLEHGRIGIRTSTDQVLNCRVQDIRHRLAYLSELSTSSESAAQPDQNTLEAPMSSYAGKAQEYLQDALEQLSFSTVISLGQMLGTGQRWVESAHNQRYRLALQAALYVAEVIFQVQDVVAVRLAKGIKSLAAKPEYTHSLLIWWLNPNDKNIGYVSSNDTAVQASGIVGDKWSSIRLVQFLCLAEQVECVRDNWRSQQDPEHEQHPRSESSQHDRLSTIPEGTEEENIDLANDIQQTAASSVAVQFFGECIWPDSITRDISNVARALNQEVDMPSIHHEQGRHDVDIPEWTEVSSVMQGPSNIEALAQEISFSQTQFTAGQWDDTILDCDSVGVFTAIEIRWPHSKFVEGLARAPLPSEVVELRFYESHARQAVIEREDHLLTADEMKAHSSECFEAMLRELKTWNDLKCFRRRQRREAPCVIDTRWVFKWKFVDGKKIIRARLTLRGFKETGADDQSNYSAAATKWSQRLLVSESVLRQWPIASTDISKAFLQGVSYEEIAASTNRPVRDVSFEICPKTACVLKNLPGYQDFNINSEVLHCLKPGTGCRDAPKAFSIQLRRATSSFGLQSTLVDPELEMLWENGTVKLLVLKHVDDLKITGEKDTITRFVNHLSTTFGKLDIHWHEFTFCGIRHVQHRDTFEITLDQTEFIKAIKPMSDPEILCKPGNEKLPENTRRHFLSLLMTIAYAVQSRPDIAVFIAALQKESQCATYEAVRRLNKVLAWSQKHPNNVCYRKLDKYPDMLVLISDSAFKARESDGLSMRGMFALRMNSSDLNKTEKVKCHLLHSVSKTQRHVTRSTFASELFAATDALDVGLVLVLSLEEMLKGPLTWEKAKTFQENTEKMDTGIALVLDAKSVTTAVVAPVLRAPAECSAMVSVAWLREQLRSQRLRQLWWCDTRIMASDGLTKGAVSRDGIMDIMQGWWNLFVQMQIQIPQ